VKQDFQPQEWAVVVAKTQNHTEPPSEKLQVAGTASKCNISFIGHTSETGVAVAINGTLGCADRFLQHLKAQNIKAESYSNYQELRITLKVPTGLSTVASLLVLDTETARVVGELERRCGQPQVHQHAETQTWTFNYCGQRILYYALGKKSQFIRRNFNFDGEFFKVPNEVTTLILREYSA